jgi:hypothetical protein
MTPVRSNYTKLVVAAVILLGCAGPLSASIVVGDLIKLSDGVGSPGGIFKVNDLNDGPLGSIEFETFCVEITEFISFNTKYAVQSIGLTTIQGGKTLSSYTAWLYNSFLDGTLNNFNPLSMMDANALQLALWKSIGYSQSNINTYIGTSWYNTYNPVLLAKTWETNFNADVTSGAWVGVEGVRVMNLRKVDTNGNYTNYAQDQLVRFPPPTRQQPVPEATSLVIWGLLVSCGAIVAGRQRT